MKRHLCCLIAVFAMVLMTKTPVQAQTLYSDAFSRTTGSGNPNGNPGGPTGGVSDWGSADNLLGGAAIIPWVAGRNGNPTGGAQAVTNGARGYIYSGSASTDTSIAASAPDGFSIAFDFNRFDPAVEPSSSNGFLSVGTGYDETINQFSPFEVSGNSSFAVLFQQAANGNVGNAEVFAAGTSQGTFDYGDPEAEHSVLINLIPDVSGAYGAADTIGYTVSVDGSQLASGSVSGGPEFGDLAFATNLFTATYIDNLRVAAIPEPGSALALSVLCGIGIARRRRSS